jgi:hypothetical protein
VTILRQITPAPSTARRRGPTVDRSQRKRRRGIRLSRTAATWVIALAVALIALFVLPFLVFGIGSGS